MDDKESMKLWKENMDDDWPIIVGEEIGFEKATRLYPICSICEITPERAIEMLQVIKEFWGEKYAHMASNTLYRYMFIKTRYELNIEWNENWVNRMKRRIFKKRNWPAEHPIMEPSIRCPSELIKILNYEILGD